MGRKEWMVVRKFPRPADEHPLKIWKAGIERLHEEIDRWFDEAARSAFSIFPSEWGNKIPKTEVYDSGDKLVVSAELPGVDKPDIDVRVYPTHVSIKAEKRQQNEVKAEDYYHSECYYGTISRNIPLPIEVDPDQAQADFTNGVLKLSLPKKGPADGGKKLEL